ncbi:hypothetical protein SAMN06265337_0131 [Hymenobacter gelipurpurascens]|uniref:Uncharacterized protein n=1 Tax=Hymenobacter gelipurpurascens TaxID=89968 RepID=A0A212T1V2_9BACT|nr:hypothetical protein [Hymenobacter gelipurpurascens]SNC59811.1 hypothetical protein SAMN06265337_0131 [Hymenobacter gelipurpurascens]
MKGQPLSILNGGAWSQPELQRRLLLLLTAEALQLDDLELEADFMPVGHHQVRVYGRRIMSEGSQTERILLSIELIAGKA